MFFIKKSRPKLKEILPSNFVDIHSHLLPCIDDGSKSIEETLFFIEQLQKMGFAEFVTTPHIYKNVWNNSFENISENYNNLLDNLSNRTIFLTAAAEYMMDDHFFSLLKNGEKLLCLKDNYILVEMSYLNPPMNIYDIIFEIQVAGYKPVLAHPERYNFYHNNTFEYEKLKKQGCLFQANLLSATGYYGKNVSNSLDFLLKNKLVDFAGSDVHHQKHIDSFDNKLIIKEIDEFSKALNNNSFFSKK